MKSLLIHLKYIKEQQQGIVIFDAHGPTTACLYTGERQRKFWIDRDQWLPYIDVLKMNLEEANASWFKKEYESREFSEARKWTVKNFVRLQSIVWEWESNAYI